MSTVTQKIIIIDIDRIIDDNKDTGISNRPAASSLSLSCHSAPSSSTGGAVAALRTEEEEEEDSRRRRRRRSTAPKTIDGAEEGL